MKFCPWKVSNSHHFDKKGNFYYVKWAIFKVQKVKEYIRVHEYANIVASA